MKKTIDRLLQRLAELIASGGWEQLESDQIEIKPVPATGGEWTSINQSVNAFLNTRGGIVLLGIREEERPAKRYVLTGYRADAEPNIKGIGGGIRRPPWTSGGGDGLPAVNRIARFHGTAGCRALC